MENFAVGFSQILSVQALVVLLLGLCIGTLFGATPGLSTSMGMAFMLPVTYAMEPLMAFVILISEHHHLQFHSITHDTIKNKDIILREIAGG